MDNHKTYHLMDYDEWLALAPMYAPHSQFIFLPHEHLSYEEWHDHYFGEHNPYTPHPKARGLVVALVSDETGEFHFHDKAKTKIDLPHPVYQGNQLLSPEHVDELHHFWHEHATVEARKDAAKKATVHDVIRRAIRITPAFKPNKWY